MRSWVGLAVRGWEFWVVEPCFYAIYSNLTAGWSPQKVVNSKEIPPTIVGLPLDMGVGPAIKGKGLNSG